MLAVETRGAGPDVLLLNGTPVLPSHLLPLMERLAASYRVWHVHLPGVGRSAPLVPYDLDRAHTEVEDTLLEHGVRAAHLVGYSGGAYRALAIARRARVTGRSVVSLAGFRGFSPPQRDAYREYAHQLRAGADFEAMLPGAMLSPRGMENPAWVAEVKSWARAASVESLASEWDAFAASPVLDLDALTVPILARIGALDLAMPLSCSYDLQTNARHADVTVEIAPGVGHAILLEDFDATAASIERHLAAAETRQELAG